MACQIEIMFPSHEPKESPLRGFFVDGGTNQSYPWIMGTGGTFAPGALPHAIGTDTILEHNVEPPPPPPPPPPPNECTSVVKWTNEYLYQYSQTHALTPATGGSPEFWWPITSQFDIYANIY